MKEINILSLVRDNIRKLKPYSSARDDFKGTASVYLDANENPNNSGLNRYPDPHQSALKDKIAAIKDVQPNQIFLGNGSDEPIDLLIRAFCKPGVDNVVIPEPTYGMYSISANINDVEIRTASLTAGFDIDIKSIESAYDERSKILFLCSPNNPSGNLLNAESIKTLLSSFPGIVVVDEAYIDFTNTKGFLPLLTSYPNLVVLQTLSKAWGLAGIRLGMCFANEEIIQILDKIKPPYNISILTQQSALENLHHEDRKKKWVKSIIEQRTSLMVQLASLAIVEKIFPSDANFFLVKVNDAGKIYNDLMRAGIIIRDRSKVLLCDNCLRITIGTESENQQLIKALKKL